MPPPLPPKRFSNGMLLGVVLVVLLAAGLGVAAGTVLLGSEPQPVAPAGAEEAAGAPGATPTEPAVAEAAEPDEADGEQAGEQSGEVLQLEEVVFEGE